MSLEVTMLELDETVAGSDFTDLRNRVVEGKEQVILTRGGKAVAALVPVEDWEERAAEEEFHPDPEALQRLDALIAQSRERWTRTKMLGSRQSNETLSGSDAGMT
jgi:prevent-host-death family protein